MHESSSVAMSRRNDILFVHCYDSPAPENNSSFQTPLSFSQASVMGRMPLCNQLVSLGVNEPLHVRSKYPLEILHVQHVLVYVYVYMCMCRCSVPKMSIFI